jgi:undecaprenyl diphosphate synthase
MDGNGRWAKKRGLPRSAGHRAGGKTLEKITRYAGNLGIKNLTVYAFSTENWKRPKQEVDALMTLLGEYLDDYKNLIGDDNIRIRVIGSKVGLSDDILRKIDVVEDATKENDGLTLYIALNYGSREEMITAIKKISQEISDGSLSADEIDEETISKHLYTFETTDPDLIIRPSGERRLSNFLLWQSAYSEFWFDDINWPDFTTNDLDRAIIDFQKRNRRYGGV